MSKKKRRNKNIKRRPPFDSKNSIEEAKYLIKEAKETKADEIHIHTETLKEIPPSIGGLKYVKHLCLHSNQLSSLPDEVKNLKNLKSIRLYNNSFKKIPPVLFEMPWLESIDLEDNLISEVDENITRLVNLKDLRLRGNEFGAPEEIFQQSPEEIINFLLKLKQGENSSLNEVKMILLGEANVGKTALVERLTKETFTGNTGITRGIDINTWKIGPYKVNIWDFGGQEIMRAMHQFFMTERTLYLLLWNSREDDTNGKIEDWLELIKTYGGNSPVILVISRCDDGNFDPDEHRLMDEYGDNIKAIIRTSSKENIGISILRDKILRIIRDINILKDKIPNNWIAVKKDIEKIERNYINLSEYYEICISKDVKKNNDQISLLRLLKDLGVAFNYGDKQNPHTTNILKPEWVTKGIYDIINSNELFQKQGKVSLTDIKNILSKSGGYEEKEDVILGLMKQFELSFIVNDDEYLIPDLLPEKQPYIGEEFDDSLQLQYKYEYMAKSIMPHFIAKVHSLSRHLEGDDSWYWRAGIIIEKGANKALIKLNSRKKILYIFVIGDKKTRRNLLDTIRQELNTLHEKIKGRKPNIIVPLPNNSNYVASYKSLLQLERQGEKQIFIEDFGYTEIEPLLNGIETPKQRRLTYDSFKDLYKTEQLREKEKRIKNNRRIIQETKRLQKRLKDSIKDQEEIKNELHQKSSVFAEQKKKEYNQRIGGGISVFIIAAIFFTYKFEHLRFIIPVASMIIALIMIALNSMGVKYSSKYCYEKWYKIKYDELQSVSNFDEGKLSELQNKLQKAERKVTEIETQIECL